MAGEQAERLVVQMRGKGGARCAGFLAPDLGPLLAVDGFGLGAQDGDFVVRECFRQEKPTLAVELLELVFRQQGAPPDFASA